MDDATTEVVLGALVVALGPPFKKTAGDQFIAAQDHDLFQGHMRNALLDILEAESESKLTKQVLALYGRAT